MMVLLVSVVVYSLVDFSYLAGGFSTVIGEDFIPPNQFVTVHYPGSLAEACTNITIVDDSILEGSQGFSVEIVSTSLHQTVVELPDMPVAIQIQDDEREPLLI